MIEFCTVMASLPMLPWLGYLLTARHGTPNPDRWVHLLEFKFWIRWVKEPLGFGLEYVLGDNFEDFLRDPLLQDRPSHFVGLLQGLLAVVGVFLLLRAAWALGRARHSLSPWGIGTDSASDFTLNAALWGFGIVLTASGFYVQRHYLVVAFPLTFVWLARLALLPNGRPSWGPGLGRALLLTLCVGQFLLTAQFLHYIHRNQGAKDGDYGICYGARRHHRVSGNPEAAPSVGD